MCIVAWIHSSVFPSQYSILCVSMEVPVHFCAVLYEYKCSTESLHTHNFYFILCEIKPVVSDIVTRNII